MFINLNYMDLYDYDSSDGMQEFDNHSISGGKTQTQALSTDHDRFHNQKSKLIKKSYQPIRDGHTFLRYEDDPVQYKKLRKKIQNRESAARVRGRKKGTMQHLQVQVQQLKKSNSELMLRNAALETENRSLKSEVEFLRGLVKNNRIPIESDTDSIDKYLNLSSTEKAKSGQPPNFESPFEQEDSAMSWIRSPYSSGSRSNWSSLFVLTIMVCLFVLPSETPSKNIIAQQTGEVTGIEKQGISIGEMVVYGKIIAKYLIVAGYIVFAASFGYTRYWKKKLKKV